MRDVTSSDKHLHRKLKLEDGLLRTQDHRDSEDLVARWLAHKMRLHHRDRMNGRILANRLTDDIVHRTALDHRAHFELTRDVFTDANSDLFACHGDITIAQWSRLGQRPRIGALAHTKPMPTALVRCSGAKARGRPAGPTGTLGCRRSRRTPRERSRRRGSRRRGCAGRAASRVRAARRA